MPRDPRVSYGTAAVIRNPLNPDQVLMLKRAGSHAAGCWSLPGGWTDYKKKSSAMVLTEVMEETGVEGRVVRFIGLREEEHEKPGDAFQSLTLYYEVEIVSGTPKIMEPTKCAEMRWVNLCDPTSWPRPLFPELEGVLHQLAEPQATAILAYHATGYTEVVGVWADSRKASRILINLIEARDQTGLVYPSYSIRGTSYDPNSYKT